MPLEKSPILLLEGLPKVMLPLPFDVLNYIWQLRPAYCEGAISILPGKGTSAERIVKSKTRPSFQ